MTKLITLFAACVLLTACVDPLSKVNRLSSVELAEDAGQVGALAQPDAHSSSGGAFAGLFRRKQSADVGQDIPQAASQTDLAVSAALSELGAQSETQTALAPKPEKRRGIFGFLKAKEAEQTVTPLAETTNVEPDKIAAVDGDALLAVDEAKLASVTDGAPVVEEKPRKGLFGLLAGARAKNRAEAEAPIVQTASLAGIATPPAATAKAKRVAKHKGPDAQIVPFGSILPSGVVARVCDLPSGRLGKEVDKFPARGRGYKIFDSNARTENARPFYVTGFDDKCARTFTAALALFGSPTMHEQLRYGLPSKVQPYSTTDKAYEGIKRSICGVGRKKACGAKIKVLERNTAFISIYDRLGSNAQWSNILLHDGWVLAADRKGG